MEVPPCLSKLSLGYNNISSAAIPIISHALSESMGLKQLSLDGNDQISDDSIAEVVNALVVNEERRLQMKKPGLKPRNNLPHWELLSLQMMGLGGRYCTWLAIFKISFEILSLKAYFLFQILLQRTLPIWSKHAAANEYKSKATKLLNKGHIVSYERMSRDTA